MKTPERISADEFVRAYIKDKVRHVPSTAFYLAYRAELHCVKLRSLFLSMWRNSANSVKDQALY